VELGFDARGTGDFRLRGIDILIFLIGWCDQESSWTRTIVTASAPSSPQALDRSWRTVRVRSNNKNCDRATLSSFGSALTQFIHPSRRDPASTLNFSRKKFAIGLGAFVTCAALVISGIPAVADAIMRGPKNPAANITASPNILSSGPCTGHPGKVSCTNPCVSKASKLPVGSATPDCDAYVIRAINNARAHESVRPMTLPSNWTNLTIKQQLFVLVNLERVDRGYPAYLGLNAALSMNAQSAAAANRDPSIAVGFAIGNDAVGYPGMGGSWSSGYSPLVADFYLMYSDGWAGNPASTANIACTSSAAPGCWAHRDQLLGADPHFNPGVGLRCTTCEVGSGFALVNGTPSYTNLIELPAGAPPTMTFTWASEAPFFTESRATVPTTTSSTTTTTLPTSSTSTSPAPTTTTTTQSGD
jgi:hypothetical protein